MKNRSTHRYAALALAMMLASTLVSAQTLADVKSGESSGTLDESFGAGGIVTTDFGASLAQAFSVAIQPDGKIVAAGQAIIGGFDFALACYQ